MMKNSAFKELLGQLEKLTKAQRIRLERVLQPESRAKPEATTAALVNAQSRHGIICAHCSHSKVRRWGFDGEIQRYRCSRCGRTFNALSGTPMARLRHRELWLEHEQILSDGLSIRKAAKRLRIAPTTAFRWRHRFLTAPEQQTDTELSGIVEADETYFPESQKGQRKLTRKARKRGGTSKKDGVICKQIAVLVVQDRQGKHFDAIVPSTTTKSYIKLIPQVLSEQSVLCTDGSGVFKKVARVNHMAHESLNVKRGIRVKQQVFHIQTVNGYHAKLKRWMQRFHGVATKYLSNYLAWHRFYYPKGTNPTPAQLLLRSMGFGNV